MGGQRTAFQEYARGVRDAGDDLAAPAAVLDRAVGCAAVRSEKAPEQLLNDVAQRTRAVEAVRAACLAPDGSRLLPRTPSQLAGSLFGEALSESERHEAAEGVLACLCAARSTSGSAPLPLRSHLFFRSLQGLWACTDPQCREVATRRQPCPVGALHYQPTLSCRCGASVELLACEGCGEVFLGGYRSLDTQNPGEWFVTLTILTLRPRPRRHSLTATSKATQCSGRLYGLRPVTSQWDQDRLTRTGTLRHSTQRRENCTGRERRCNGIPI